MVLEIARWNLRLELSDLDFLQLSLVLSHKTNGSTHESTVLFGVGMVLFTFKIAGIASTHLANQQRLGDLGNIRTNVAQLGPISSLELCANLFAYYNLQPMFYGRLVPVMKLLILLAHSAFPYPDTSKCFPYFFKLFSIIIFPSISKCYSTPTGTKTINWSPLPRARENSERWKSIHNIHYLFWKKNHMQWKENCKLYAFMLNRLRGRSQIRW